MSPALANFLFEAGNFILLAGVLGWLLFKPVRGALDRENRDRRQREEELTRRLAEVGAAGDDARRRKAAFEEERDKERGEILAGARVEALRIHNEARHDETRRRRQIQSELETGRREDSAALAEDVGRLAGESVRQLLDSLDGPSLDLALIRGGVGRLGEMSSEAIRSARVETARPLSAAAEELLGKLLGEGFQRRTVPELGAGIRIVTDKGQIDASAAAIARDAASRLTRDLVEGPGSEQADD